MIFCNLDVFARRNRVSTRELDELVQEDNSLPSISDKNNTLYTHVYIITRIYNTGYITLQILRSNSYLCTAWRSVWETWLKWQNVSAIGKYGDVIARDENPSNHGTQLPILRNEVVVTGEMGPDITYARTVILHQINCDNCPKRHLFHTKQFLHKVIFRNHSL